MAKITVEELKTALKADADFTDDQLTGLSKAQLEKLAEGYMRQSDYDRLMNEGKAELQKAQSELETANQRLNAEMAEWAQVQSGSKQATDKMRADLEAAQNRVLLLQQRVTRIATDAGLDVSKALEGIDQPPPKKPDTPQVDLTGLAKLDDVNQQFGRLANMALELPAILDDLRDEHHDLFGKRLNTQDIVKEIQARAGTRGNTKTLDPRAIWEELHKVPERRAEVEKKKFDDAIKSAEQRGREAALSEQLIPGSQTVPGRHAPVFGEKGRDSVLKRPQPQSTVHAAASAFRSGKYRKSGAGSPTGT